MRRFPRVGEPWEAWASDIATYLRELEARLLKQIGQRPRGCVLSYVDGDTIEISPGSVWADEQILVNSSAVQIDKTVAANVDPDSGAVPTDGSLYVYALQSRTEPSEFECYFSTVAPTALGQGRHPTKDWAYLGAVWVASGSVRRFTKNGRVCVFCPSGHIQDASYITTYPTVTSGAQLATITAPPNMDVLLGAGAALEPTGGTLYVYVQVGPSGGPYRTVHSVYGLGGVKEFDVNRAPSRVRSDASRQIGYNVENYAAETSWTGGAWGAYIYTLGFVDPFMA